jgi:hypothetical protein
MSSLGIPHPGEDKLLRFADGELDAAEAKQVREHLSACWECRSQIEEIERTIAECIEYRKTALETCMPPPPQPWFDIRRAMDRANAAREPRRFPWVSRLRPARWIPAGAIAAAAVVAFFYLENAPAARAADLLKRASIAAHSRPATPRRIQIRTKTATFVRTIDLVHAPARTPEAHSPAGLEAAFQAAHYSWDDPLSAAAYSGWRDQLRDKKDVVLTEPGGYVVRTTTNDGELAEARLELKTPDLRAVEAKLRFRNDEWVELSELPEERPAEVASVPVTAPPGGGEAVVREPAPDTRAATASDELAVVAALHRLGADLGDPVEVTRSGSAVVVSGSGVAPVRQQEIRSELEGMPRVSVRFDVPGQSGVSAQPLPPARSGAGAAGRGSKELEDRLGNRAAYDRFVDSTLDGTEAMMARAYALRRLALEFPAATEGQLAAKDRATLRRMVSVHAEALAQKAAVLQNQLIPVLGGPAARDATETPRSTSSWQQGVEELFQAARRADALVIDILGGVGGIAPSQDSRGEVLTALEHVRATAEGYGRLTTSR